MSSLVPDLEPKLDDEMKEKLEDYARLLMAGDAEATSAEATKRKQTAVSDSLDYFFAEQEMGVREIVGRLSQQARGEYGRYFTPEGVDMVALVRDDKGHLIKSVKHTQYGLQVEFYDAQSALVHVGKYHKIFKEQVEHSGQIKTPFADSIAAMQEADRQLAAQKAAAEGDDSIPEWEN